MDTHSQLRPGGTSSCPKPVFEINVSMRVKLASSETLTINVRWSFTLLSAASSESPDLRELKDLSRDVSAEGPHINTCRKLEFHFSEPAEPHLQLNISI